MTRLRGMQLLALTLFAFGKLTGIGAALAVFFANRPVAGSLLALYVVLIVGAVVAGFADRRLNVEPDDLDATAQSRG